MQVKIILDEAEVRSFMQQAQLINNGESLNGAAIVLTIDDNRIAVDVANCARSKQREVVATVNHISTNCHTVVAHEEPVNDSNGH